MEMGRRLIYWIVSRLQNSLGTITGSSADCPQCRVGFECEGRAGDA